MTKFFIACCTLLVISGCSHQQKNYSPLSAQEIQKLQVFKQVHSLNTDCISKKLQLINQQYCDQESHFCNIPPESSFNYQQWLSVYQSCQEAS